MRCGLRSFSSNGSKRLEYSGVWKGAYGALGSTGDHRPVLRCTAVAIVRHRQTMKAGGKRHPSAGATRSRAPPSVPQRYTPVLPCFPPAIRTFQWRRRDVQSIGFQACAPSVGWSIVGYICGASVAVHRPYSNYSPAPPGCVVKASRVLARRDPTCTRRASSNPTRIANGHGAQRIGTLRLYTYTRVDVGFGFSQLYGKVSCCGWLSVSDAVTRQICTAFLWLFFGFPRAGTVSAH